MAGSLRAEATLAIANGLYLVFLLLGGFILPLDRLAGPIGVAAHALPAAALTDATRGALDNLQVRPSWGRWRCWRPGPWWPSAPRRSRFAPSRLLRWPPTPRPDGERLASASAGTADSQPARRSVMPNADSKNGA